MCRVAGGGHTEINWIPGASRSPSYLLYFHFFKKKYLFIFLKDRIIEREVEQHSVGCRASLCQQSPTLLMGRDLLALQLGVAVRRGLGKSSLSENVGLIAANLRDFSCTETVSW